MKLIYSTLLALALALSVSLWAQEQDTSSQSNPPGNSANHESQLSPATGQPPDSARPPASTSQADSQGWSTVDTTDGGKIVRPPGSGKNLDGVMIEGDPTVEIDRHEWYGPQENQSQESQPANPPERSR